MWTLRRTLTQIVAVCVTTAVIGVAPALGDTGPTTVSVTYGYTGETTTFTVPDGITQLTLSMRGAEGGRGGGDSTPAPPAGGYQGVISGTIMVTPGQVLAIAVGQGGATGDTSGAGSNDPASYTLGAARGGLNPLAGYLGGNGGVAGPNGSSGFGGAGGAATIVTTGSASIVAGGGGGSGGSGQFAPTQGRLSPSTFTARSDIASTTGQEGITVVTACNEVPPTGWCDGGGSGGGGGGTIGGEQGAIEFGSGSSNEWFGYGGSVGGNSTAGVSGLSASYQYYGGNGSDGALTISYGAGVPGAPTAVHGTPGNASVPLTWSAPAAPGASAVSDYLVESALSSTPDTWTPFAREPSVSTSATVTGLTNDSIYIFRISAVNATGQGAPSAVSEPVTPAAPPTAPTDVTITPVDGGLSLAFTAAYSGSPILHYEYQLGTAGWVSSGSPASPLPIAGLVNGTPYSVRIRAVNAIGDGAPSSPVQGTPAAAPGAPSITSISTGVRSATVTFTPGYAGGAVITGYDYQLDGAAEWISAETTASPLAITNLADGTSYAIAIRAVTAAGPGSASLASTITTPTLPGAPLVVVTGYDQALSIAFSAGGTGGSPITAYEYQLSEAGEWTVAPSSASPIMVSELLNGTSYDVSLRAVNAVGAGAGSTAVPAKPVAVPGAPTIVGNTVAGSDLKLSAAFTAPASDGGTPIVTYEYSTDAGATWRARDTGGDQTASPLVISRLSSHDSPLLNGTTYWVELRAWNSVGPGAASDVALGIPQVAPAAPTIDAVVGGPSSLRVTFSPGSNGGATITGYEYNLGTSSWVDSGTLDSTFLIAGLTNGTAYDVTVRAVNTKGAGTASSVMSGTPVTLPGRPDITGVVRADRSLTASVAATDGGSAIIGWEYSTDGGTTWWPAGATVSPLTITALSSDGSTLIANGSAYPVTVRAVSAVGTGVASTIVTVGPGAAPSAPTVTLTSLDQSIQVNFTVPDDGGSPISAVKYRLGGSWTDAGTLTSPFTIGSLVNGASYSVEVRADNAIGTGAPSTPAAATPATVPDAPTKVVAVSNTASADVSWAAPASDGGAAVTKYVVTATPIAASPVIVPCGGAVTSCSVAGLTDGTEYSVSVVAVNAAGSSAESSPPVLVTPLARPGQPTDVSVVPGDAFLRLSFTAGSHGSATVTGYDYQLNGGDWQPAAATSSPVAISGLTNGTSYEVSLRATSAAGAGLASSTVTATPYTYPDAPDAAMIVAGGSDGGVTVAWSAPEANGSPITDYTATAFSAATAGFQLGTCSTTGTLACAIGGLANGSTYYIGMQARNAAGLSARSTPRVAVDAGPVTVAPTSLAPATFGVAYSALLTTVRGSGPFVWSHVAGSLPPGLTLSSSGAITGTPSAAGTSAFTVRVDDSAAASDTAPLALDVLPTAPSSPGIGSATGGNGRAVVTFTAPASGGGRDITGYTATAIDTTAAGRGGQTGTISGSTPGPITVTGLTNGDRYTFSVTATNDVGTGPASDPSNPVIPSAPAPLPLPPGPVAVVEPSPLSSGPITATPDGKGYWTASPTGTVHAYGDAVSYGSSTWALNRPIVGMVPTADGRGYWLVADDGGIFAFGNATYHGSTGAMTLNQPIAGMTATPDGRGYWLVAQDGGIFAFGNATYHGSTGAMTLNQPISGIARTHDGNGYWLVARDGGIFAFGSASFSGSTGGMTLNRKIVGMAANPGGHGYWLVADDGGIFAFGNATYHGSAGAMSLNRPISGMAATPDGHGYWLVAQDGGIFTFGSASFYGSTGGLVPGLQP